MFFGLVFVEALTYLRILVVVAVFPTLAASILVKSEVFKVFFFACCPKYIDSLIEYVHRVRLELSLEPKNEMPYFDLCFFVSPFMFSKSSLV